MATDERERFLEWSATLGMSRQTALYLLKHLPDDGALDPELPSWIESPSRVTAASDPARGFGLEKEPLEQGFLIIGTCPNGDPVMVALREPDLPVFYLSHEQLHERPLQEVMRNVSDSLAAFDRDLSDEDSGLPLDYWDLKSG